MNYEEKYKQAIENFKKIKFANSDNKKLVNFIEDEYPELRESEDERNKKIKKEIIEMLHYYHSKSPCFIPPQFSLEETLAWLEKQGEQIIANSAKICKDEQNPIDEVKPKFNVGDWITNGEYTWKVTDIKPLDYILQSPNGDVVDDIISYVDEEFNLWTIQDAKDGDVLSSGNPFIFRGFGDKRHPNCPTAYCGIDSLGTFILSCGNNWWTADDSYPATKEQRDLLFQKMKEAEYEWDAKRKELKKNNQESAWNEKIKEQSAEWSRQSIIGALTKWLTEKISPLHKKSLDGTINEREEMFKAALLEMRSFVNSPGFQIGKDTSVEWSEEDENKIMWLVRLISTAGYRELENDKMPCSRSELLDWLKSLKPRWKPTEEQMEALKDAIIGKRGPLYDLYFDLEKL